MALNYSNIDSILSNISGSQYGDYLNENDSALVKIDTHQHIGISGNDDFIDLQIYDTDKNYLGGEARANIGGNHSYDPAKGLTLNPGAHLRKLNFNLGKYICVYTVYQEQLARGKVHIHEISPSRKEIRIRPVYSRDPVEDYNLNKFFHDFAIKVQSVGGIRNYFDLNADGNLDMLDMLALGNAMRTNGGGLPQTYQNHPDFEDGTSINWTPDDYQIIFDYLIADIIGHENSMDIYTNESRINPFLVPISDDDEDGRLVEFREKFSNTISKLLQSAADVEPINSRDLNFFIKVENDFNLITNWKIDRETFPEYPYSIVLKLYDPLPDNIQLNSQIKVLQFLSAPIVEKVQLVGQEKASTRLTYLRGHNEDIDVNFSIGKAGEFQNWNDLLSFDTTTSNNIVDSILSSSLGDSSLNVDYTDYTNFVNFSSAEERLKNFRYKMKLVEYYDTQLANFSLVSGSSSTLEVNRRKRRNLLNTFDAYEKFLYYDSGSVISGSTEMADWPKSTSVKPYALEAVHSSEATSWYQNQIGRAQAHDRQNENELKSIIPTYLSQDTFNDEFLLFLDMMGHHFDIFYTYIRHLTDIHKHDEGIDNGLHKDFIHSVAKSFNLKLHEGNDLVNLWKYSLGTNLYNQGTISVSASLLTIENGALNTSFAGGTLFVPDITGSDFSSQITTPMDSLTASLDTSYAGEFSTPNFAITYGITGSLDSSFSSNDATKEIWKRLLNNLPYMLKTKGTARSIKALLSCYGIPNTILNIKEYGGPDVTGKSYYEHERFVYALNSKEDYNYFKLPWKNTTEGRKPDSIEFRFNSYEDQQAASLLRAENNAWGIDLLSSGTSSLGYVSFKLSGDDGEQSISSSKLPIYDGDFWQVVLQRGVASDATNIAQTYTLDVKKAIDERVSYTSSAHMSFTAGTSASYKGAFSSSNYITAPDSGSPDNWFSGSLQEFRLWNVPLSTSVIDNHTIAPLAYNGNFYDSLYNDLEVRLPFTRTVDHSTYAYVSNDAYITTYCSTASLSGFGTANNSYKPYEISNHFEVPNIGPNRLTNNKIRLESASLDGPLSRQLRSETRATDFAPIDSGKVGVYFSPQQPINDDIIANLAGLELVDYIGDPSDQYEESYADLKTVRDSYFTRYSTINNFWDYIRLIQFYDSTLFDHIKSLLPARAHASVGLIIEPHILERAKGYKWKKHSVTERGYEDNIDMSGIKSPTGRIKVVEGAMDDPIASLTGSDNPFTNYAINTFPTDTAKYTLYGRTDGNLGDDAADKLLTIAGTADDNHLADVATRDWTLPMMYTGSWGQGDFLFNAVFDQSLSPFYIIHSSSMYYQETEYTNFSASEFPMVDTKGFVPVAFNDPHFMQRLKFDGIKNTIDTTYDKKPPVEVFHTSPSTLVVTDTGQGNTLTIE